MIESQACGTAVVAFDRGAAQEVVQHGVTGFVVDTIDQMVDAVREVDAIDARRCRENVKLNFDVPRMVDHYVRAYQYIIAMSAMSETHAMDREARQNIEPDYVSGPPSASVTSVS